MIGRQRKNNHGYIQRFRPKGARDGKIMHGELDSIRIDASTRHCSIAKHRNGRRRHVTRDRRGSFIVPQNRNKGRPTATTDFPDDNTFRPQLRELDRQVALFLEESSQRVLRVEFFPFVRTRDVRTRTRTRRCRRLCADLGVLEPLSPDGFPAVVSEDLPVKVVVVVLCRVLASRTDLVGGRVDVWTSEWTTRRERSDAEPPYESVLTG